MQRDQALLDIHAFVDGELGVERQLEIERAMADDPVLRSRVAQVRDVRAAVRDDATYHPVPEALRARIEAMTASTDAPRRATAPRDASPRTVPSATPSAREAWARWWDWRPLSAAMAATVALSFGMHLYLDRERRETRLVDEVVASHVRSTLGEHAIDIASSDHHTVKPWLSSKLDFSPPVRDTGIGSAVFLGGRVDYLDGRPVAALVYRQGPHLVDAFVWPVTSGDRGVSFSTARGYQIARWTRQGMCHWVVSDVNRAEFVDLVNRLSSTSDDRPPPAGG